MTNPEFREPIVPHEPKIAFLADSFLTLDDQVIELPDLIDKIFDMKLHIALNSIQNIIAKRQQIHTEQPTDSQLIDAVKIGRLGIAQREDFVLTESGMTFFTEMRTKGPFVQHFRIDDLFDEYKGFWTVLEGQGFKPVIESGISGLSPMVNGTWLSAQVNPK